MDIPQIFDGEYRLAQILWERAPMTTRELVGQAEAQLNWKRTTTYTVLKKLCDRGIFKMENKTVTVLIPREQGRITYRKKGESTFGGSLPSFIAAFAREKRLTAKDIAEIRRLIDDYEENGHA